MKFVPSPNFNERAQGTRVQYVVLHYTALETTQEALAYLCDPAREISAHYLVDREGDVIQLVDEARRAWHAGKSMWKGQDDINSRSVGVELVNNGDEPYPEKQTDALIALVADIAARHDLAVPFLLGHSDIAPARKKDPGVHFPWKKMAEAGLAPFPDTGWGQKEKLDQAEALRLLWEIGYPVLDGLESEKELVSAFQRRYRPRWVDGQVDGQTSALIQAVASCEKAAGAQNNA